MPLIMMGAKHMQNYQSRKMKGLCARFCPFVYSSAANGRPKIVSATYSCLKGNFFLYLKKRNLIKKLVVLGPKTPRQSYLQNAGLTNSCGYDF